MTTFRYMTRTVRYSYSRALAYKKRCFCSTCPFIRTDTRRRVVYDLSAATRLNNPSAALSAEGARTHTAAVTSRTPSRDNAPTAAAATTDSHAYPTVNTTPHMLGGNNVRGRSPSSARNNCCHQSW